MKQLMLLTIVLAYTTITYAQNNELPRHEIGFNATPLFSNIFINNPDDNTDQFSVLYKKHDLAGTGAFRLGLGISASNTKQENFNGESTSTNLSGQLTVGYEFRKSIHEKWIMFYGLDTKLGYTNQNVQFNNNFDEFNTTLNILDVGIAPLFGIEFQINKHIRLATELSFLINYSREKITDNSNVFTQFNETQFPNKEFTAQLDSPAFIYMIVRF